MPPSFVLQWFGCPGFWHVLQNYPNSDVLDIFSMIH
jgi:hypothetical protein